MSYEVELRRLQPCATAVAEAVCRREEVASVLPGLFAEVAFYLEGAEAAAADVAFARFLEEGGEVQVEAGYATGSAVPGSGRVRPGWLPGGEAAVCLHEGPRESIAAAYDALREWLRSQKREAAGDPWEVYLTPPGEAPARIEVVWPLAGQA